ncbi:Hypothetical predicted protein [Mytilus galloprovincialis]|uniref:Uncharacterized protein n=1 Tax=Mytilus galloprovincialis TaxID=29158 RepID=A0A8B6GJW6_MYTGA|nr:Hypothetical predicted protein [Mytilus galloprovincialis]
MNHLTTIFGTWTFQERLKIIILLTYNEQHENDRYCDSVSLFSRLDIESSKLNVSTSERKERSTQLPTENRVTKRHSTAIPEGTSDINTEVLYRSQTREEKTTVVYIIYSSSGALALSCILLFILGMFFLFKRLGSSKIIPIYNTDQIIYDEIPEDMIPSDVVVKRPVVSPQLLGYYNDNTDVLLSKQHSGNLEGSESPPYYNEQKEYDYAYKKSDDYYLNPYNSLQTTGYSDHLYHDLKG